MSINLKNFLLSKKKKSKIGDFQDLEHIDGVAISVISADLYNDPRDDLVLFYFRDAANYASVYTQSKIISENIKWNLNLRGSSTKALLVNAGNANAFTGKLGFKGISILAEDLSKKLTIKMSEDDEKKNSISSKEILFGSTGTIGEKFPTEKIRKSIPELIERIKYTQNKYLWMKAALGIMTTDLSPKLAMEECKIGNSEVKIYGIAKGSGMIFPNMATTLGFIFTDANLPSGILQKLLKKNIETTFNAVSCDGDTSTNDMVTLFSTKYVNHSKIKSIHDPKLKDFDTSLHTVLLNLAKRIAADGEGASKFISVNIANAKNNSDAKKVAFSIANSPLVKTAIGGEDPNWGRIIMAIGKSDANVNLNKLAINFGSIKIIERGHLFQNYEEAEVKEYMRGQKIDLNIDLGAGNKSFTAYTMDLTKKYIEINSDYRS